MYKPRQDAVYELNQHVTVHRLMFVTSDISIDKAGEGLLQRLQVRILSFS